MASHEIKLCAFDMGHVIIDFDWPVVCEGFARRAGWSSQDFAPILKYLGSLGYETGRIGTTRFLHEINQALGTDIDQPEFATLWNATFTENHEMAELLTHLKGSHCLYLLSNTNECHFRHIQEQFNVERHFDEVILSYEVGSAKPDSAIYREVLSLSGLDAAHCLFIDDLEENVWAASRVGMKGIVFEGPQNLKKRLQDIGVIAGL